VSNPSTPLPLPKANATSFGDCAHLSVGPVSGEQAQPLLSSSIPLTSETNRGVERLCDI
jgi:hypothetical protein